MAAALVPALLLAGRLTLAQEDRSQQALARAQALLRQVSAQKQELEVANARLTAELDAANRKLEKAQSGLKQAGASLATEQRKAERAGGALEDTRGRLDQANAGLREIQAQLREATARLREQERQRAETAAQLSEVEAALADSERKNLNLFRYGAELMELYRDKGPIDAVLQREPSGLKSAAMDILLEEYRLKLDDSLTDTGRQSLRGATPPAPAPR